mgnify:FL=1
MSDITIVKFKVRRGSDAQRSKVILDRGEVGYTIDTKRLFVGDGVLSGGNVIGSKFHGVFNLASGLGSVDGAQIGDIGVADSMLYALTASTYDTALVGWGKIGAVPDNATIEYNSSNMLTVKLSGANANILSNDAFGAGLIRNGSAIDVNYNTNYFELSSATLSPKPASITEREMLSGAFTRGLSGGSGTSIQLDVDTDQFGFDATGKLTFLNNITHYSLSSANTNSVGDGLTINDTALEAVLKRVDGNTLGLDLSGTVGLVGGLSGIAGEFAQFTFNQGGAAQSTSSSVFDVLTGLGNTMGDTVPLGTILPHARAFNVLPPGYLLCDGYAYNGSVGTPYHDLFTVIGTNYGGTGASNFQVPNLSGDVMLYGADTAAPGSTTYYLSSTNAANPSTSLSAVGVNFIIKYKSETAGMFNGAPNQVSAGYYDSKSTNISATDSLGQAFILSSAGFMSFALSGTSRQADGVYDRFAIPVFSW